MKKRYWMIGAGVGFVAAKLLLRPLDVDWETNRSNVFHADYSRFARIEGIRVHYQEAGNRHDPALLLIHGFASSTLVWSKVLLELASQGFRVIAPDLVGFGYSGKPRNLDYTIASQARMLIALLDHLKIDRAILLGSSYGAAVAATIALDHAARVEKLVLIGAVTNNHPTRYMVMRLFSSPVIGDIVSPFLLGSRRLLRRRMKRVYDRHSWTLDERRVDARHLPLQAARTQRAIIRTVRQWDADRVRREAHLISHPTLIVWGDKDRDVPLRDGEQLQQEIRGARLIVFRDCGHLPQEEYPLEFTKIVASFSADLLEDQALGRAVG